MLGKLMKYEFKATARIFLPAFAALIVMAAVNRLLSSIGISTSEVAGALSAFVAILLIGGVFALVIALTISRFKQNFLTNEGHLMMTLPVTTDSLILSKLFTASIWGIASFIVTVLAILIMAGGIAPGDVKWFFELIIDEVSVIGTLQVVLAVIEILAMIVLALFSSTLMLYTCISLGMLVGRHRGVFSFVMFIAISTILQIIAAILVAVFAALEINFSFVSSVFTGMSPPAVVQTFMVTAIVAGIIQCTIFYLITRYMLKNRLNLQ